MDLKAEIQKIVEEKISKTGNFLVEIKVSPSKVIVIIDHPQSVSIEQCSEVSRYLQEKLEESDVFEKHELEVSSPGMEEPLKVMQQYQKRTGKQVSVLTFDGLKRSGKLISANEEEIVIEEIVNIKDGNKKYHEQKVNHIPFKNIKETKVIFSFDKII